MRRREVPQVWIFVNFTAAGSVVTLSSPSASSSSVPSPTTTNPTFSGFKPSNNEELTRSVKDCSWGFNAFVCHCAPPPGDIPSPRAAQKEERPDSSAYDYRGNGAVAGARSSLAGWLGGPLRIRKKSMVKWRWRREKAKQIG